MIYFEIDQLDPQSADYKLSPFNVSFMGESGDFMVDSALREQERQAALPKPAPAPAPFSELDENGMVNLTTPTFEGENQASDTWAWITRAQWADWENRFKPREDALMGMATYDDPALAKEHIQKAQTAAGGAFDASAKMSEQYFSRYGAGAISGSEQAQARSNSLGRSAAIVDAGNRITQKLIDQNRAIAIGAGNTANAPTQTPQF